MAIIDVGGHTGAMKRRKLIALLAAIGLALTAVGYALLRDTGSAQGWTLEFSARFAEQSSGYAAGFAVPVRVVSSGGSIEIWEVLISDGVALVQWSDAPGTFTGLLDSGVRVLDGGLHRFRVDVAQDGRDVAVRFSVDGSPPLRSVAPGQTAESVDNSILIDPDATTANYVSTVSSVAYRPRPAEPAP